MPVNKDTEERIKFHTYTDDGELKRARTVTKCPAYADMHKAIMEHGFGHQDIEWAEYRKVIVPKHIYIMLAEDESVEIGSNVIADNFGDYSPDYDLVNPFPLQESETSYRTDVIINKLEASYYSPQKLDLAPASQCIENGREGFEKHGTRPLTTYTEAWGRARQWRALERALASFIIELCSLHHYKVFGYWLASVIGQIWLNPHLGAARAKSSLMMALFNYHAFAARQEITAYDWSKNIRTREKLKDFIIFIVQAARLDFFTNISQYPSSVSYLSETAASIIGLYRHTAAIFDTSIIEELILNGLRLYKMELGEIVGSTQHMSAICMDLASSPDMQSRCRELHEDIYVEIQRLLQVLNKEKGNELGVFYYRVLENGPKIIAEKMAIPPVQILSALIDHISSLKREKDSTSTQERVGGHQTAATLWLGIRLARILFSKVIRLTLIPGRETPHSALKALSPWVEFCVLLAQKTLLKFDKILYDVKWEDRAGKERVRIRTYTFINSHIEAIFTEMKYRQGLLADVSHAFPMPIQSYHETKEIKPGVQVHNTLLNAAELLRSNSSRIIYSIEIIKEVYDVILGTSANAKLLGIFWHIMGLSYKQRIQNIPPASWDKLITLVTWLRMLVHLNVPGTITYEGHCLVLWALKSMDWRGRQYMSGVGSITDTKLCRFLVTSGYGPIIKEYLLASAALSLTKYSHLKTKDPFYISKEALKNGDLTTTHLHDAVVLKDGRAIKDLVVIFSSFFRVWTIEKNEGRAVINSAIGLEYDCTSSGPQIVSHSIGDIKTAERSNAIVLKKVPRELMAAELGPTRDLYFELFALWLSATKLSFKLDTKVAKSLIMKGLYGQVQHVFVEEALCPELLSEKNLALLIKEAGLSTGLSTNEDEQKERQAKLAIAARRSGNALYLELLSVIKEHMPCYAQYLTFIRLVVLLLGATDGGWSFELAIRKGVLAPSAVRVKSKYHTKESAEIGSREYPLSARKASIFKESINEIVEKYLKKTQQAEEDALTNDRVYPAVKYWDEVVELKKQGPRKRLSSTLQFLGPDLDMKKMQRASVANFTHAYDAALLINTINALAVKGIYVSAVHDMYILHPMHLADFMAVLQSEFEYVTSHMRGTILAYCAALKKELGLSKAGKIQKSIDKMTTEQAIKLIASIELSISNYESARLNYTAGQLIQLK